MLLKLYVLLKKRWAVFGYNFQMQMICNIRSGTRRSNASPPLFNIQVSHTPCTTFTPSTINTRSQCPRSLPSELQMPLSLIPRTLWLSSWEAHRVLGKLWRERLPSTPKATATSLLLAETALLPKTSSLPCPCPPRHQPRKAINPLRRENSCNAT